MSRRGERAEQHGEERARAGRAQGDAVGVLDAEGARGDAERDEAEHHHDERRGEQLPPDAAGHQLEERARDEHVAATTQQHVQEQQHVDVAGAVVEQRRAARAAPARPSRSQLVDAGARDPAERRLAAPRANAGEHAPARRRRASDRRRRRVIGRPAARGHPLGEQPRLQPEHLGVLLGLGVVVAEQVQDPVGEQQRELVLERGGRPPRPGAAPPAGRARRRRAGPRLGLLVVLGAAQLVHRERQHVGGPGLVHPPHVQVGHRGLVDEHDRQLGLRMDAQPVEHEARPASERVDVDLDVGLVDDLDAHRPRPTGVPRRAAARLRCAAAALLGVVTA